MSGLIKRLYGGLNFKRSQSDYGRPVSSQSVSGERNDHWFEHVKTARFVLLFFTRQTGVLFSMVIFSYYLYIYI